MYTLEQLIAMNDETLIKAARDVFGMRLDPFSELGRRTIRRRLEEAHCLPLKSYVSPALKTIIGTPVLLIEQMMNYQESQQSLETGTSVVRSAS